MAAQLDPNVKDDLKTQFITREGTYRLMTLSEYSRPNRVGYTNSQSSPQVRVSIVTLPNPSGGIGVIGGGNTLSNGPILTGGASSSAAAASNGNASNGAGGDGPQQSSQYAAMGAGMSIQSMMNGAGGSVMDTQNGLGTVMGQYYGGDRICFNFGRELYVYAFRGVKKGSELSKPIDKKFYKGTNPSCHDFNAASATPSGAPLLVGFTTGQIQLVSPQPGPRELRKLYNEERLIDKTKVTCLKWLPNSPNLFLASHASGHLYLYNEELPCAPTAPNYQPFKLGDGYSILTCKSKSTRNPLYKWVFSTDNCCINEFCFSPCGSNLAIVSQDGFLRVFHYDTMELLGIARSYFGGFLCVCWSPDGKYIVVGGEDDLVTVWSLHERRVVARGQGHRSWVSVVAFDPYTTSYTNWDGGDFSDDENQMSEYAGAARFSADSTANGFDFMSNEKNSTPNHTRQRPQSASFRSDASSSAALAPDKLAISYRLGSVSQDTQLCLWDITEDVLRHPLALRQRVNSLNDSTHMNGGIDADGVKLLRPVAIGNVAPTLYPPNATSSPTKDAATTNNENSNSSSKHSSNSSSSKFSTANCTISSQSSSTTTPPEEAMNAAATNNTVGKVNSSSNKSTGNAIKFPNCISATKTDFVDGAAGNHMKHSSSSSTTSGYTSMSVSTTAAVPPASTSLNSKVSGGSNKSSDSGISTFNSLTQRLSNFSFLNNSSSDKKSSSLSFAADAHNSTSTHRNHRKATSILKSYGGGANSSHNNSLFANSATLDITGMGVNSTAHNFGSLKLGKSSTNSHSLAAAAAASNSIINSYDPMKLIGTSACPRFDECPLLEPLICKKIAHERLTALIFREDCFLTACQDGFIYTWARPGYTTTVPQHMSPSPSAPPGGTVV